ncbi:hypothetical protein CCHR01_17015 [Colletotrichum chrysophilum]|uniref:Uncharacterized protein n=1 Tax=Colletotrichum chrysophilum TaxID=1836956 RepID=A0AAD9A2W1_9PEZI|nr:hypothetical protein K456DRAFT_39032 [Colletotrichum gloeosporioides 23]KAK1840353.1 hypothetical protein CCHR01_17015 [Colletotrichum chrysophilum]
MKLMSSRELASLVTPHAACSPSASREIILLSFSKQRFLNQGAGKGGAKEKKRRNGNQCGASYFASLPCNPPATNVKGAIDGTPAATQTCRLGRGVASATCRCTTKQASRLGRSPLLSLSAEYSAGVAQRRGRQRRVSAANLVRRGRWAPSRDRVKLSNSTNVTGWELQMGSSHRRAGDHTACGPNAVRCRSSQAGRQAGGEVCFDMFGECGLASSCLFARAGCLHHTIAAKMADGKHSVVDDQAMTVWQLEDAA